MAFTKLDINSLRRFPNSGVCDVCNKPITPGEAYMIDNYTFYHSPEYRENQRNGFMAKMMGTPMNDSYFEAQYARDTSTGSAICPQCIHMFAEQKKSKPGSAPKSSRSSNTETKEKKQGIVGKLKKVFGK